MCKVYPSLTVFPIGILLVFMALVSCDNSLPSIDSARLRADASRSVRLQLGLRDIRPGWVCFRSLNGLDEWIVSRASKSSDKNVKYMDNILQYEEDSYFSGKTVIMSDQFVKEQLIVHYNYINKKGELYYIGNDGYVKSLVDKSSKGDLSLLLACADDILLRWGLARK